MQTMTQGSTDERLDALDQRFLEADRRMGRVENSLERVADGLASLQKTMVIGWVTVLAALATLLVRA
jgi:hypothetical protein